MKTEKIIWIVVIAAVIIGFWYLRTGHIGPLTPPIGVTYRESSIGKGIVLEFQNQGRENVYHVAVAFEGQPKRIVVDTLAPGETKEAGWMQLDTPPKRGVLFSIYADGYAAPIITHVQ
jgi:hypothetical protein